jgi:RNA polymerase sigma factor (sigma-70 family)
MSGSPPIIHVVDDDKSFRSAIGELLSACGYKVSLYETAAKLLENSLSDGPACILLDLQMTGLDGVQLQDRLSELGCRLPIVFISAYGDIPTTVHTIKAGAEDFLTKPVTKERLLETIQRALARYEATQAQDDRISLVRSLFAQLTPREREVFDLLVRGRPHKQISYELGISERTVKLHRHQLVQKLRVRSLAELAVIAERLGLLPERDGKLSRDDRRADKTPQTVASRQDTHKPYV